jgi:GntR family transcriptional regulator
VDELAQQFGVARATIRQAFDLLEADGLIERFRAKGTFVKRRPQEELWCELETDWKGLLSSREHAKIELLSKESGQRPLVHHPIGTLAESYQHVRRRHWMNGQPFLLADVYIHERLAPKVTDADLKSKTALRLVAGIPGVTIKDARQTLTIGAADLETSSLLKVPLNAPVCHVTRSAVDHRDRLALVSNGIYRGDIVRLDIRLR